MKVGGGVTVVIARGDSFTCGEGVGVRVDPEQTGVALLARGLPAGRFVRLALRARAYDVPLGRLHDAAALLPLPARVRQASRRRIEQVNTTVDEAAGWPGVRVLDLLLVPALARPGGWAVDRIHPSGAGHHGMAAAAIEALRGAGRHPAIPVAEVLLPGGSSRSARGWWAVRHGLPYAAGHLREIGAPLASAVLARR